METDFNTLLDTISTLLPQDRWVDFLSDTLPQMQQEMVVEQINALFERSIFMARRPLPQSQIIVSTAKEPALPRKGETRQAKPQGCADELNTQRKRPVWDEKRP